MGRVLWRLHMSLIDTTALVEIGRDLSPIGASLKGVRTPDHEVLLGQEYPQQG